jgi:hypothetical protein
MKDYIDSFTLNYSWYRNLSLRLLDEIPEGYLGQSISERSLSLRHQFIDLGILPLKILELLLDRNFFNLCPLPDENTANKTQILEYLKKSNEIFEENITKVTDATATISWFGRMDFNCQQALNFILAHEAMHHGEILSFIFAKNIEMPAAYKETWGFEL